MNEQLIDLETAKLAKNKGFKEETDCAFRIWYDEVQEWFERQYWNEWVPEPNEVFYSRPNQSLLQKWLRDVHGWHIIVIPTVTMCYTFKILKVWKKDFNTDMEVETPPYEGVNAYDYKDYEEALEQGLQEVLKLID
jgi:hypothetical protein